MTNSANLQWEVAGGKKNTTKKVTLNGSTETNGKNANAKDFISKIPKLSTNRNLRKLSS